MEVHIHLVLDLIWTFFKNKMNYHTDIYMITVSKKSYSGETGLYLTILSIIGMEVHIQFVLNLTLFRNKMNYHIDMITVSKKSYSGVTGLYLTILSPHCNCIAYLCQQTIISININKILVISKIWYFYAAKNLCSSLIFIIYWVRLKKTLNLRLINHIHA